MISFDKIKKQHENQKVAHGVSYRLGQFFCNKFIKRDWPELFHASEKDAESMIKAWLIDHNYEDTLPPVVSAGVK
jgi:hypothetical protein